MATSRDFRFLVGAENKRLSSIYKLKVRKGSAYLMAQQMGGIIKASFHDGGVCTFGFTSEYWNKNFIGQRENSARWKRPPCSRDLPIVMLGAIRFQSSNLKAEHDYVPRAREYLLRPPSKGQAVELQFLALIRDMPEIWALMMGQRSISRLRLSKKEDLLVVARAIPEVPNKQSILDRMNSPGPRLEGNWVRDIPKGATIEDLHITTSNKPNDGQPLLMEELSGAKFTRA